MTEFLIKLLGYLMILISTVFTGFVLLHILKEGLTIV